MFSGVVGSFATLMLGETQLQMSRAPGIVAAVAAF